ncbi:MAG: hypothetical protein JSV88_28465 [Candidatus Aminicenantes bacterium]|nr:MAG: hypothetical protein JSV88_28465 [Candidatus Aminicenantes bacterium]
MKKDYQILLAEAIFKKSYENLDDMQRIFVDYHLCLRQRMVRYTHQEKACVQ